MNSIVEFLNSIWDYISSAEVLGTISFGSVVTFIITFFTKNWQTKKANAKYGAKCEELKVVQEAYDKYIVKSDETVELLAQKYLEVAKVAELLVENAKAQNEAMRTAFNNSNLVASAKKEVEQLLLAFQTTTVQEDEIKEDVQTPISNAVNEAVDNEESKIIRIK